MLLYSYIKMYFYYFLILTCLWYALSNKNNWLQLNRPMTHTVNQQQQLATSYNNNAKYAYTARNDVSSASTPAFLCYNLSCKTRMFLHQFDDLCTPFFVDAFVCEGESTKVRILFLRIYLNSLNENVDIVVISLYTI